MGEESTAMHAHVCGGKLREYLFSILGVICNHWLVDTCCGKAPFTSDFIVTVSDINGLYF